MERKMPTITVFTPLYNRKDTLKRTYNSLVKQTNKDFLWLIIDDGSTDDPYSEIKKWMSVDNGFEIKYIYKENGGMHTAHNTAYAIIDTELNVCIDSDDYMPCDAIEKILKCWNESKTKGYAGIIALDYNASSNKVIGKNLPDDKDSITLSGYYNDGGEGDKKLIYRTDIIKQTPPYPVFDGEKYVALAYKYYLIDEKYELKILNENVCMVDYQLDGSSTNMYRQYVRNPKGFAFWRKEQMKRSKHFISRFKACVHYVSSSLIDRNWQFVSQSPCIFLTLLAIPLGAALTIYIKRKAKKSFYKIKD